VLLSPGEEAMANWRQAAGCGRGRGSWGQRWSKDRQGAGIPGGVLVAGKGPGEDVAKGAAARTVLAAGEQGRTTK